MARVLILTELELRRLVPLDLAAVENVAGALRALAARVVVMPPILRLDLPGGRAEMDVKTAFIPDLEGFAVKISPGFFDNPARGLPSTNGMMVLLDAETGLLRTLLLDNGYLTDVRTAAAGAVAARHLARQDASVAAVLGAGMQARLQLAALALVRPIRQARVWARRPEAATAMAQVASRELGFSVTATADPEAAVASADVIVTATSAHAPILRWAWLRPGQHVTAIGSDAEHKNELEPAIVAGADRYVADSGAQASRLGERHHAIAAGLIAADMPCVELGQIVAGTAPGRADASEITVADLTGTGAQDTAIAVLAARRAAEAGAGMGFNT